MRKTRLLAGLVALGLFAVVGTFTVRAFATPAVPMNGQQATETRSDVNKSMWQETRGGSVST